MKQRTLLFYLLPFAIGCVTTARRTQNIPSPSREFESSSVNQMRINDIANPGSEKDVYAFEAMAALMPTVDEPPAFWIDLANDLTFTPKRRALFVLQLLSRHVRTPATFGALSPFFGKFSWLRPNAVNIIHFGGGFFPLNSLRIHPDDVKGIASIKLPGEEHLLFIAINRGMSESEVYDAITNPASRFVDAQILDIGW